MTPFAHRFRAPALMIALALVFAETAYAATVRGRLDRTGPYGLYPAAGVAVTLFNPQVGRSSPAYTGMDGMYFIFNVPPGNYNLEIWPYPGSPPVVFPIVVRDPGTDVPPIKIP